MNCRNDPTHEQFHSETSFRARWFASQLPQGSCFGTQALALAVVSRSLTLAAEMRVPIATMIVLALLMPNRMGGWLADIRLPVALPFVVIASTQFRASRKVGIPMAAAVLVVVGLRIWTVS